MTYGNSYREKAGNGKIYSNFTSYMEEGLANGNCFYIVVNRFNGYGCGEYFVVFNSETKNEALGGMHTGNFIILDIEANNEHEIMIKIL